MNPATLRRFPLVARPRPACTPLPHRVADLQQQAELACRHGDVTAATAVFNLAALLASDCGLPDLARTWCHQLADITRRAAVDPRHSLEPIVNLARLHTRAGDGTTAWNLLDALFQAVDTATDTTIDGVLVETSRLTHDPATYAATRRWMWTVLLGTGTHALATTGRWDHAHQLLARRRGIGNRMLDGRQITVLAHHTAHRHDHARALIRDTHRGEPWENAVTACLALLVDADRATDGPAHALAAYRHLDPGKPGLTVFHARLGLTLLDALNPDDSPAARLAADTIHHAMSDGNAARDVLLHPWCLEIATDEQRRRLTTLLHGCGLDAGTVSQEHRRILTRALDIACSVIADARPVSGTVRTTV